MDGIPVVIFAVVAIAVGVIIGSMVGAKYSVI
jgi:hypothetical protein